jgi:hypothetical protein
VGMRVMPMKASVMPIPSPSACSPVVKWRTASAPMNRRAERTSRPRSPGAAIRPGRG